MKSDARLGESAPSTSTPSTGVDRSSAGDPVDSGEGAAGRVVLMTTNLGEPTDNPGRRAPYPRDERGGSDSLDT